VIIDTLALQDGDDFKTSDGIIFRHPKVSDVKFMGEQTYIWWMFSWLYNQHDLMHQLWFSGVDYETITKDEIFISTVKNNQDVFFSIFKYFTNVTGLTMKYNEEYEMELLYFNTNEDLTLRCITPFVMDEISSFIKKIHNFKNSIPRKFGSNADKGKILEYEIEEMKRDMKNDINNLGYISGMKQALVIYNARTWEYVSNLYIYQLVSEVNGINKLEESKRLYQGIYAGTVDYSKIDKKLLNWVN